MARRLLARVKEDLAAYLENGSGLRDHVAVRSAESLIGAAWLLLGEQRGVLGRHDLAAARAPACHLIRGAIEDLSRAASGDDAHMPKLIRQLDAVLELLETGPTLP